MWKSSVGVHEGGCAQWYLMSVGRTIVSRIAQPADRKTKDTEHTR